MKLCSCVVGYEYENQIIDQKILRGHKLGALFQYFVFLSPQTRINIHCKNMYLFVKWTAKQHTDIQINIPPAAITPPLRSSVQLIWTKFANKYVD